MRVRVSSSGLYTYPHVSIVCGEPQFEDDRRDTLLNPTVIIEVLSPSTESYDRGKKFQSYRTLESFASPTINGCSPKRMIQGRYSSFPRLIAIWQWRMSTKKSILLNED